MRGPAKLLFVEALKNEISMELARIHLLGLEKNLSGAGRIEGWEIFTQLQQLDHYITKPPALLKKLKTDDLFQLQADVTALSRRTNRVLMTKEREDNANQTGSSNHNYGTISAADNPSLKDTDHLVSLCSNNSLPRSCQDDHTMSKAEEEGIQTPIMNDDVHVEGTENLTEDSVRYPVVFTLPPHAIQSEDNVENEWEDVSEIEPLLSKHIDLEDPEAGSLSTSGSMEYFEGGHKSFWRRVKDSWRRFAQLLKKMFVDSFRSVKSIRSWFWGSRS